MMMVVDGSRRRTRCRSRSHRVPVVVRMVVVRTARAAVLGWSERGGGTAVALFGRRVAHKERRASLGGNRHVGGLAPGFGEGEVVETGE